MKNKIYFYIHIDIWNGSLSTHFAHTLPTPKSELLAEYSVWETGYLIYRLFNLINFASIIQIIPKCRSISNTSSGRIACILENLKTELF